MASVTEFASVSDITTITGITVTEVSRNQAANVIEMLTGLIESIERADITNRDRYWLKLATAYEAVFIEATPDFMERMNVAAMSGDGESFTPGDADAHILAPLARKAIKRLSWAGPRGLKVGARVGRQSLEGVNVNSEEYDDSLPWRAY